MIKMLQHLTNGTTISTKWYTSSVNKMHIKLKMSKNQWLYIQSFLFSLILRYPSSIKSLLTDMSLRQIIRIKKVRNIKIVTLCFMCSNSISRDEWKLGMSHRIFVYSRPCCIYAAFVDLMYCICICLVLLKQEWSILVQNSLECINL